MIRYKTFESYFTFCDQHKDRNLVSLECISTKIELDRFVINMETAAPQV